MQTLKFIGWIVTLFVTWVSAMLWLMSMFVRQPDGVFFYGLSTIAIGALLKWETDRFWF